MCILLVRTTKLLAQKIRYDNTGSAKFFFYFKKKSLLIFSYNVVVQSDKLDHIFLVRMEKLPVSDIPRTAKVSCPVCVALQRLKGQSNSFHKAKSQKATVA